VRPDLLEPAAYAKDAWFAYDELANGFPVQLLLFGQLKNTGVLLEGTIVHGGTL
jgi:hypothetical protein